MNADPASGAAPRLLPQADAYTSPWSLGMRLRMAAWLVVWTLCCRWTPKFCSRWRVLVLGLFGARVSGRPFVSGSARIKIPWHLTLEDRACLAPECVIYNLAPITLRARSTVAQEAYLCAGSHDLSDPRLQMTVAPIEVGEDAFIFARAMVLPGVRIGAGAVIGAAAVVTKDMPAWTICAGNPCRPLKPRPGAASFPSYRAPPA